MLVLVKCFDIIMVKATPHLFHPFVDSARLVRYSDGYYSIDVLSGEIKSIKTIVFVTSWS